MTLDELEGLLAETEQVEAGGRTWDVGDPTHAEALDVQQAYLDFGAAAKEKAETMVQHRKLAAAAVMALVACVRAEGMTLRLDDERAGTVLRKTGSPASNPLVDACFRRCGILLPDGDEEDAGEADPT